MRNPVEGGCGEERKIEREHKGGGPSLLLVQQAKSQDKRMEAEGL